MEIDNPEKAKLLIRSFERIAKEFLDEYTFANEGWKTKVTYISDNPIMGEIEITYQPEHLNPHLRNLIHSGWRINDIHLGSDGYLSLQMERGDNNNLLGMRLTFGPPKVMEPQK